MVNRQTRIQNVVDELHRRACQLSLPWAFQHFAAVINQQGHILSYGMNVPGQKHAEVVAIEAYAKILGLRNFEKGREKGPST